MKPCKTCGRPIGNDEDRCPECGAMQASSVRVSVREEPEERDEAPSGPTPGSREWLKREAADAASVIGQSILTTAALAAVGGTIGYLLFDLPGLVAGAVIGSLWTLVGAFLSARWR